MFSFFRFFLGNMPLSFTKYMGDTLETYDIVALDYNNAIIDLTEATLSLRCDAIGIATGIGSSFTGTGNWTITAPTAGMASYTWSQSDLSVPGLYLLYTIVSISSNLITLAPVMMMILQAP